MNFGFPQHYPGTAPFMGGQAGFQTGTTVINNNNVLGGGQQNSYGGFGTQLGSFNQPPITQNFYGPQTGIGAGVDPLGTLLGTNASTGLSPLGIQNAVTSFTNPLMANPLLQRLPIASQVLGGSQFGNINNFMNPFTFSTMPFGNPYLTPDMMALQQQMAQMQQQPPPQQKKPNILKIFGLALGGFTLLNLITGKNILGGLFGGGNNNPSGPAGDTPDQQTDD